MTHLIYTYFIINACLAGYLFDDKHETAAIRVVVFIVAALIGLPLAIIYIARQALTQFYITFQIRFFYRFFFTHEFDQVVENGSLEKMNKACSTQFNSNSISDRMFRLCVRVLNRKFDFKP